MREETKREKMRVEAGKRAIGFEEKFSERGDCKILQECWKEIRKEGENMFETKLFFVCLALRFPTVQVKRTVYISFKH